MEISSLAKLPTSWWRFSDWEWVFPGVKGLFRSYAAILFVPDARVGASFLLATLWFPNTGLAGLMAAITGTITARVLQFADSQSGLYGYNSLLVGLALGATYKLDERLIVLIFLAAILTVFVTVSIADALWRFERLPALSLPFVLVAFSMIFAAQGYGGLSKNLPLLMPINSFFSEVVNHFLISLASIFFIPHPIFGLILFTGILLVSRYLAFLAISGYFVGHTLYYNLSDLPYSTLTDWAGFNFTLTAISLGGIFMVPGVRSFIIAMLGAAFAAVITTSIQTYLSVYDLPVMAMPFLLITLTLLTALNKRVASTPPFLLLDRPDLPEASSERSRLVRVRGGQLSSIPVYAPFFGEWVVYQGFNGRHTHHPPWQHALDFIIMDEVQSYRNSGTKLEDYYCFGVPVVSPVYGTVVRCINNQIDNLPGEINTQQNWGNLVLINLYNHCFVLLCHLKQYSLEVVEGQVLEPGQIIGCCGNSGRSPQPHLHLHIQKGASLNSPTVPFHLTQITTVNKVNARIFQFYSRPLEKQRISFPTPNPYLKAALHLPVGKQLYYRFRINNQDWESRIVTVIVTIDGQFSLKVCSGSEVAFSETDQMLALYDRSGNYDLFLDLFALCLGVTPFGEKTLAWQDQPSRRLFPLPSLKRVLENILYWPNKGLFSCYQRCWEEKQNTWLQTAEHQLNGIFSKMCVYTQVTIAPEKGCTHMVLNGKNMRLEAELCGTGLENDIGIPQHITNIYPVFENNNETTLH
jgi:urea transporter/murein DD-endopeptidase MepM/ murein hydrolase activator NlpD